MKKRNFARSPPEAGKGSAHPHSACPFSTILAKTAAGYKEKPSLSAFRFLHLHKFAFRY